MAAGTYTVTVTDAPGCTVTRPVTITQPDAITIATTVTNAISCTTLGNITTVVTGGNGGNIYRWSNGQTTANATNLGAGTYSVTVTDSKGCTGTRSGLVVTAPISTLNCLIRITQQMTGNNTNDAKAQLEAYLGTAPYTYKWSTGATTQTVSGLAAGTYTGTVTDAAGCTTTCSTTVVNNLCNNVTNPGVICCSQTFCAKSELVGLTETTPASGGNTADALQYLWMFSTTETTFSGNWTALNVTTKDLPLASLPAINAPTSIIRCVRRANCADYIESNIVVLTPRAFANITGLRNACINEAISFTAQNNGVGATYSWTFQGGSITSSTSRTPTVTFATVGQKTVTLSVTNNGCTATTTITVNINPCFGGAFGNLVGFNANPLSTKEVMLDWATSNEQQPSRFLVQKSKDGITFNTIGELASQNGINNLYRFSDKEPKMGRSYYRIRQIAPDNSEVRTSDAKKVLVGQNGQNVLTYPNPAQSSIFVEVLDADNLEGTVEIYNHIGALVRSQKIVSSIVRFEVNTENLPIGTYVLKIRHSDGRIESAKISKM